MEATRAQVIEAEIALGDGVDPAFAGAVVTAALCGHWEHDGPCRWPHQNALDEAAGRLRTVFVAPDPEVDAVRARVERALRREPGWRVAAVALVAVAPDEAPLAERLLEAPRLPPGDRAFVLNVADAPAVGHPRRGTYLGLEPEEVEWPDLGVNIQVLEPGRPNGRYHAEPVQEDFLVLHGECLVILDGEERRLRRWDFVHCPAGTEHIFVGAGDGPCAVLMIGSRREDRAFYPVSEVAARYDASVASSTGSPAEAYADWRREPRRPVPNPWPLPDAPAPADASPSATGDRPQRA